jgi:KEOPS complex subunit Cgi121
MGDPEKVSEAANKVSSLVEPSDVLKHSVSKNEKLISQFSITDAEIEAVGENRIPELVLERVALVDILK